MASTTEYVERSVRVPRIAYRKLEQLARREMSTVTREINIAIRAHLDAAERGEKR